MQTLVNRDAVRPLFNEFPGLHGAIDAILEGAAGDVFADSASSPGVARMVVGDFHLIAGDLGFPTAVEALRDVPKGDHIAVPDSWHDLLRAILPSAEPRERFAMRAPEFWPTDVLQRMSETLPAGYSTRRVDEYSVKEFRDLNPTFVANFASIEDYLERGVGFAVSDERSEIVAGCSTYAISSRCLEFEIETRKDHQRRGLALAAGARMVMHCLEQGLEPCWDAAHEGSAVLAERLGFVPERRYMAYRLG